MTLTEAGAGTMESSSKLVGGFFMERGKGDFLEVTFHFVHHSRHRKTFEYGVLGSRSNLTLQFRVFDKMSDLPGQVLRVIRHEQHSIFSIRNHFRCPTCWGCKDNQP